MSKSRENSLRIAMLGHKRIPSREGGIEVVVEELSTRMVDWGNSVTCYNRRGHHVSGKQFDKEEIKAYKGIQLKSVLTIQKRGLAAMTSSVSAAIRCAFGNYDLIHFHAEGPCAMIWLPKLFGKKCVATIHGLDHQRAKWGKFASNYIMLGEKCAAKYADEIIVLSEGVQRYFRDMYNRETLLIPNGVNRPKIREVNLIKENWGLEKDDYILYLGRIVPEKGLKYLIKAFRLADTNKKLVIAGGASDTDGFMKELKSLADGDDRIIFTGFVQGQALEELYSNAYIYTLPSDLEGMPLSLLEGMSYGNCCLTSDIPECADVVGDKAVTFYQGDVDDLAQTLGLLCANPDKVAKYKNEAADYICKKYNWDDVTRRTLDMYERVLTEKEPSYKLERTVVSMVQTSVEPQIGEIGKKVV